MGEVPGSNPRDSILVGWLYIYIYIILEFLLTLVVGSTRSPSNLR
jgi:hypothetical protein